jgi:hypothetical protein
VYALLIVLGAVLFALRGRVLLEASLAALLVLPLVTSPAGSFGGHVPTAAERLDLAAVRWLLARKPAPVAVGWDTPALQPACLVEAGLPCPLPLRVVSLADARPGSVFATQFRDRPPSPPPPGWRLAWSAEDGSRRGSLLQPRWERVRAVIWEKELPARAPGRGERLQTRTLAP